MPLISMVTICRNSAATIRRTIESVLACKDRLNIEYIIIDGMSSDGTQEIVRSYGASIDHFVSETDRGIADAFNKGIILSKGEIIGLINSDDRLLPRTLEIVTSFFLHNPASEVVHGDVLLYEDNQFVKRIRPPRAWWLPWRMIIFNHPATFVRKSVYQRFGLFDITYGVAMDVEIYLRWKQEGVTINYLPDPLVRMQSGGVSSIAVYRGFGEAKRAFMAYGYPQLLVILQFYTRFLVQQLITFQWRFRKLRNLSQ